MQIYAKASPERHGFRNKATQPVNRFEKFEGESMYSFTKKNNVTVLTFFVTLLAGQNLYAQMTEVERGRQTVNHSSPGGLQERCVLPKPMPGADYSKKDIRKEEELCKLNFYQADTAICPKLFSTSPGIEIYQELPNNMSKQNYEAAYCKQPKHRPGDKVAKFKQTITCLYTPSIMSYYHISRYLQTKLVPPGLIRTMDAKEHHKVVEAGTEYVRKLYSNPSTIIRWAWESGWPSEYSKQNPLIFTADKMQVFGGLSVNPGHEEAYKEVSNVSSYETRYQDFKRGRPYQNLADRTPVSQKVGKSLAESAQLITQMKDVSDLIVLDTLLNQQDRIGNIHYKMAWVYAEAGKIEDKSVNYVQDPKNPKSDIVDPKQVAEMQAKGAVQVKQMLLKDNDCGVAKSNMARANNLIEDSHHMSLVTYKQLQQLQKDFQSAQMQDYFKREFLFNDRDVKSFKDNLDFLAKHTKQRCLSGDLLLDLDLDRHLSGAKAGPELCQ